MGQTDWQDIAYLQTGNSRQRAAYHVLEHLQVLTVLQDYEAVLVGTIPLGIDVDKSDLDIICEVYDLAGFQHRVTQVFGQEPGFIVKRKEINGLPTVVARFYDELNGFPIEIFGQPRPVTEQNAYRHMVIETHLLDLGGESARRTIHRLKQAGLRTEPAFVCYFNLKGDPYQVLLRLSRLSSEALREWLAEQQVVKGGSMCR